MVDDKMKAERMPFDHTHTHDSFNGAKKDGAADGTM